MGALVTGCVTTGVQTSGITHRLEWYAKDFTNSVLKVQEREVYNYTLVLKSANGMAMNFNQMKADIQNSGFTPLFEWQKKGQWVLPANSELEIRLGTYRVCRATSCDDWGTFAPIWNLQLMGIDETGLPVRERIKLRLPIVKHTRYRANLSQK